MTKIIWTDSAVKDLEHISDYISLDSMEQEKFRSHLPMFIC